MPSSCAISPASGPSMWAPSTRSVSRIDHQLHQHLLVAAGQRLPHRPERSVDLESPKRSRRILLGQADRADLRLREHRGRDLLVVRLGRLVRERGLDEAHRLVDRHRRQLDAVGDVADRPDVVDAGARILVDHDRAVLVQLHADRLKPKPSVLGIRPIASMTWSAVEHFPPAERASSRPSGRLRDLLEELVADHLDRPCFSIASCRAAAGPCRSGDRISRPR